MLKVGQKVRFKKFKRHATHYKLPITFWMAEYSEKEAIIKEVYEYDTFFTIEGSAFVWSKDMLTPNSVNFIIE